MAAYMVEAGGSRGSVSRLGGADGGVWAICAGWEGGVRVRTFHKDGVPWLRVDLVKHRGKGREGALYDGPLAEAPIKGA